VISELGVGEALVSTLQEKGIPMPVERSWICPPLAAWARSRGESAPRCAHAARWRQVRHTVDRESAEELLAARARRKAAPRTMNVEVPRTAQSRRRRRESPRRDRSKMDDFLWGTKRRQGAVEAAAKSATRTVASGLGRQILRGVLGSMFGGKKR
jgi:hypothetical protein